MNIETSKDKIRIELQPLGKGSHFVDILDIKDFVHYAVEIIPYDYFSYWALIEVTGDYNKHKLVVFPNKKYFDEWYRASEIKPKIIFKAGKE